MVHYSVIIPQRDCGEAVRRQLPRLRAELDRLRLPFEILCVDDGSTAATLETLAALQRAEAAMRVLTLDQPSGTSTALSAGIAAARGDIADRHRAGQSLFGRADSASRRRLVAARFGRRPAAARGVAKILASPRGGFPAGCCWDSKCGIRNVCFGRRGARRWPIFRWPAACGAICRGWWRGAASASATCMSRESAERTTFHDPPANPLDLLTAWWTCRRWRNDTAHEIGRPA